MVLNMIEKRRYTNFHSNSFAVESTPKKSVEGDDVVNGTIRDILNCVDTLPHLYDVITFSITDQTFIDDPLIANAAKSSGFPHKLILTVYDANGTVERHYKTKGTEVRLVKQKDSFHDRIILLVNDSIRKRGLDPIFFINDLSGSNLSEINRNMVNFLDQL